MKKSIILSLIVLVSSFQVLFAQKRETRDVSTFTKVNYRIHGKLFIRQGNTQKVELEADADVLEKIETEVSGNKLSIGMKDKWWNWNWGNEKLTVYITVKNLEGFYLSGSGDVVGETAFNTGDIEIKIGGSGNLKMEINATGEMDADISGSGNMELKGKCASLDSDVSGSGRATLALAVSGEASFGISGSGKITASGSSDKVKTSISGSGKLLAADFATKSCNVRISGSGDVEINVKDELDASISGSGSVS
jgi:hypothetical protein